MRIWTEAVRNAVRRHVAKTGSPLFTRQALIESQLQAIMAETRTLGLTPTQTLGRELQELRDAGLIEFLERGVYRWLGDVPEPGPMIPSKGILVLQTQSRSDDLPERSYAFRPEWLHTAARTVGQWIIYQDQRGYHAAAQVERIDSDRESLLRALIKSGSYLEFGRIVPLQRDGVVVERSLLDARGRLNDIRAAQPVRAISDADFDRILELGLIAAEEVLPRIDADEDVPVPQFVSEERTPWEGPIDRATMLFNRKVRDKQFRKRVLEAYGSRCALTGMKLINGGGRAETEAAHIMSVEAGGPDRVNNGIALSGTIHWMFDRGLISLSDAGDILLSRAINDRESVERLIYPDRRARLPREVEQRPHSRYLHWHRTECFHD